MFRRAWRREIKASGLISSLKFSIDSQYLVTNLGKIKVGNNPASRQNPNYESLKDFWVSSHWVGYGAVPVFHLPTDSKPQCYDTRGDQVAIGLENGQVLSFDIDRISLNLIYKLLGFENGQGVRESEW